MKKIFFLFFSLAFILFSAADIFAADFLFFGAPETINTGDEFKIDFIVDANSVSINAVAGKIIFSNNLVSLQTIETGKSGVNFWVEPPKSSAPGKIEYSGIVPNGFHGKITLFSAIFKANATGTANFSYDNLQALVNDGKGTADAVSSKILSTEILAAVEAQKTAVITTADREPPNIFSPEIVKNENLFNGDYALIFQSDDKQSGIDHYQILEKRAYKFFYWSLQSGTWEKATSPYRLHDQKLKSEIFVRAIDRQGNGRTVNLPASSPIQWYENRLIWSIIIVLMAIVLACVLIYGGKRKKNNK